MRTTPRVPHAARAVGFTLIETMIVVALLALLASLAAPGMQRLIAAQQLRSASYDMVADLTLARSEALKRGAAVQIAPAGTWLSGWTVSTGGGALVLGQRNALGGGITVPTSPASFSFDINGRLSSPTTVRIGFANGYGGARCIVIDPSGRPRSLTTACPS